MRNFFPGSSVLRNWSNIWEVWQFSINPWCVRVYGKLPNLTNLASVSENRGSRKYFRCSCLAQGRLWILEWSNQPEILVPFQMVWFKVLHIISCGSSQNRQTNSVPIFITGTKYCNDSSKVSSYYGILCSRHVVQIAYDPPSHTVIQTVCAVYFLQKRHSYIILNPYISPAEIKVNFS